MQYWVNEQGQMLTVVDVTKMKGSDFYRKLVKHDRYIVSSGLTEWRLRMSLSFDTMAGVRFWMKRFGFKQQEKKENA